MQDRGYFSDVINLGSNTALIARGQTILPVQST